MVLSRTVSRSGRACCSHVVFAKKQRSDALRSMRMSGRGLNKVQENNSLKTNKEANLEEERPKAAELAKQPVALGVASKKRPKGTKGAGPVAAAAPPTSLGIPQQHVLPQQQQQQQPCAAQQQQQQQRRRQQQQQQPALFAWVVGGGKNLTPVRRCGLGGPHPRTSGGWRRLCQRIGHTGVSKHAEMAAIAALQPQALQPARKRLTLVVVRLRKGAGIGGSERLPPLADPEEQAEKLPGAAVELGLARPCDECAKMICALGCFRRVVYSTEDGRLVSSTPEELLQHCTPSSGKRLQQKRSTELLSTGACSGVAQSAQHWARDGLKD
eukprot:CAMPEP_0171153692 /NCGR_PEP_ID=MMETSP0766_2-20121228/151196_1 /TAXON_ID=439317 /ORGANISM="Gambierdiscus australes, Strain CAWD 149" /LENGTH=325 /DNA_ID=CAMNT_0011617609 /DNA_START=63 /DNA_END=1044 /DNA_ORIENTATION=-